MGKNQLYLLLLSCATATSAVAQQLYKTVGPDGKITFSDRPVIESKSKLSIMKGYLLEPEKTPGEPAAEPAKRAVVQIPVGIVTPEIETAMVAVMALTNAGHRFERACQDVNGGPAAFEAAANGWRQRNAAHIEHEKRLLTEAVSPRKRAELLDKDAALLETDLAKAVARGPLARKEWCGGLMSELNSTRIDAGRNAMLALPVTPYVAK